MMNPKRGRWGLLPILVLVNAAAIWGQAGWAYDNLIKPGWHITLVIAVCGGFAAAIELTGVFLANKADQAEDANIPAGGIRLGSYAVGVFSGVLNFSHFLPVGHAAALAFGFLSMVSPFLWGIDSRVRRGRQVAPSRRFWHPLRSISLLRFAAWEGIADEELALRTMNAMSGQGEGAPSTPATPLPAFIGPLPAPEFSLSALLPEPAREWSVAELLPETPVSPAPSTPATPRAPRALSWDAPLAAIMAVDGAKAREISEKSGASPATAGLFVAVAKRLRADPRAEISAKVTGRSVNPEYVRMMREAISR